MSWLQDALDKLDGIFRGTWFRKAHKDYYDPASSYYFAKDRILVYIQRERFDELTEAYREIGGSLASLGVWSEITYDLARASSADVQILVDKTVPKGGVTHVERDLRNRNVIVRAVIHIAESEKGKSLRKTAVHETTHLYTSGHSDDDRDANHSPCYSTVYSSADRETIRRVYAARKSSAVV